MLLLWEQLFPEKYFIEEGILSPQTAGLSQQYR